ncbi:uracil-DNA glycosylase family protein [Chitinibacter tainanensis]|uniref:uracil-DNA glycosylase family protein n=1 Tax=Chitinibacter tainanensis TaxID=230667 RepID=UPI0003FE0C4F|nr:uracil-DNA glycosylase family protein [Chitinibacter tainanensis]
MAKIVSSRVLENGMSKADAEALWSQIMAFGAYGFNKSHAVAYSLISYQSMWLKVNYPAEFYAACLSVLDEDKLPGLVRDAENAGLLLVPPDVNLSSADRFEIGYDVARSKVTLVMPFNRVKGISTTTAELIVQARNSAKVEEFDKKGNLVCEALPAGPFTSKENFEARVNKSKVNVKVRDCLDRVGAFAGIEPSQLPALHNERLKDQIELLPGLISGVVKADRNIEAGKFVKEKLMITLRDAKQCTACSLAGGVHPSPRIGRQPKFMAVIDAPSFRDERNGKVLTDSMEDVTRTALGVNYLTFDNGYWTALVKSPKPKDEKFLADAQIAACSQYIEREIEILAPPVIVTLGSAATRYFLPDARKPEPGTAIFSAKYNATIIVGISPGQVLFDDSKQATLNEVFRRVAEAVN